MVRSVAALFALVCASPITAESVDVGGRSTVDVAPFACTDTPRSTVVQRVCYNEARRHLLVNVRGVYSEYCHLPAATFEAFVVAPSMGQFFRQRIEAAAIQFDCGGAN
jgi:hypothetical protein